MVGARATRSSGRSHRRERLPQQGSYESSLVCLDTDILVGLLKGEEEAIEVMRARIGNLQSGGHALSTTIVTAARASV